MTNPESTDNGAQPHVPEAFDSSGASRNQLGPTPGTGFALVKLLIVIGFIVVLTGWLFLPNVAKVHVSGEAESRKTMFLLVKLIGLWWLPLLILAKFSAAPTSASWRYPEPGRPLVAFKAFCRQMQSDAKALGAFWWLMVAVDVVGILFMPRP